MFNHANAKTSFVFCYPKKYFDRHFNFYKKEVYWYHIPFLDSWGGAQKYLFECLKRWDKKNDTTIYTVAYNKELYKEYDSLSYNVKILNPPVKTKLMNLPLLLQKNIISKQIDKHEIYNSHMFPLHSLNLENNIWTPQEPSRILYDLRAMYKTCFFYLFCRESTKSTFQDN